MNVSNRYEAEYYAEPDHSVYLDYDANKKVSLVQRIKRALPFFKGTNINIRYENENLQVLVGRVRAKLQNSDKLTAKEAKQGYKIYLLKHVERNNPHAIFIKVREKDIAKSVEASGKRNGNGMPLRVELKGILKGAQSAVADFQTESKSPKTWGDYFKTLHIKTGELARHTDAGPELNKLRDALGTTKTLPGFILGSIGNDEQTIKRLIGVERERVEEARALIDDIKNNLLSDKDYSKAWDKSDYKKALHELDKRLRNIEFILADDFVPTAKRSEKAVRKDLDRAAKELDQFASFLKRAFKLDEIDLK